MKRFSSKRAASLGLGLLLFVTLGTGIVPKPAEAFGLFGYQIVLDPVNLVKNTITSVASNIIGKNTDALTFKEYTLDGIANAVAKAAVQSVVHGVVNWANTGFNGSPSFVVNIQGHLGAIADQTASTFFTQLTGFSLNSPFQAQVSSALQAQYYRSTSGNSFFLLNQCTLGDAKSAVSANGFDFNKGGLSGWFAFTSQTQNNPYGLYFAGQNELNSRIGSALTRTQNELNQNNGFFSWRGDCKLQGIAPAPEPVAPVSTENPDGTWNFTTPAAAPLKDNGTNCLDYDIETPGSIIQPLLVKNLGSGIDQLISADEINEVVNALAVGLISNVLGGNGLSGTSKPQGGGSDYFTQPGTDASSTTSGIASNLSATIKDKQTALTGYQANLQTISAAALTAQAAVTKAANSGHACTFGEGSSAVAVLQNVVNPLVDNVNTAIANTTTSLSTLANIQTSIANDSSTNSLANAALNYQNFLSAQTTPSNEDIANAQAQSVDLSGGSTSTTTPAGQTTIVTELNNITREAQACAP